MKATLQPPNCSVEPGIYLQRSTVSSLISTRDDWPVVVVWIGLFHAGVLVLPVILGLAPGLLATVPLTLIVLVAGRGCDCRIHVTTARVVVVRLWLRIPYHWQVYDRSVAVEAVGTGDWGDDDGWPIGELCEVGLGEVSACAKPQLTEVARIRIGSRRLAKSLVAVIAQELHFHGWTKGRSQHEFVSHVL